MILITILGFFSIIVFFTWLVNEEKFRSTQIQAQNTKKYQNDFFQDLKSLLAIIFLIICLILIGSLIWKIIIL